MEYKFQAEVKQVLDIVINSLYTDKEIFVRELVSNASDASEKERFSKLSSGATSEELNIKITTDEKAGTFSIEDAGIGMTSKELIENLGTIAHSGSKAFVNALKENKGNLTDGLIGQFGVGFYSVFMVADKVDVYTKSENGEGLHWACDGSENFTIEDFNKSERGTKIVATLKPDYKEFASKDRIKAILSRYSSFVEFPILVDGEKLETKQAIWLKSKSELTKEQYEDFYKFFTHSYTNPLDYLHFKTDAPLEMNALIYVPSENPELMGFGKSESQVALYCKKVLIDPSPKNLFPEWMRFAKGLIDSSDIPLNISRESMQDSGLTMKLGKVVLKKFIKHLLDVAKKDADKYTEFFKKFGHFIKEGSATDFENRKDLSKLLRFQSSLFADGSYVSLEDYVSRMKDSQKSIYYAVGIDRNAIEASPYIEAFTARGIEVLYMYDGIDTFLMGNLINFEEKNFESVDSANVKLDDIPQEQKNALPSEKVETLKTWIKETLGSDKVKEIVSQGRLIDSPVAVLNTDSITPQMRAMLKAMNPDAPLPKPVVNFEINPSSDVIKNLDNLRNSSPELAKLVLEQLFDNAMLSAGLLESTTAMSKRLNEILAKIKA
ncbi:MAG: molecular chaperone HtpG [Verrucomicrobiaceae bacterium]|nr:molecular chaperone HtpG [Verrucomicrobiaceae bacterium]